jgi:hypothetical protein
MVAASGHISRLHKPVRSRVCLRDCVRSVCCVLLASPALLYAAVHEQWHCPMAYFHTDGFAALHAVPDACLPSINA